MLDDRNARTKLLYGGFGAACFVLLLVLEIVTETDEITFEDMFIDGLNYLLTIGAAVGVALLANRLHIQREEHFALVRDLEIARSEGNGWRDKVRSHLAGLRAGLDTQFDDWGMTAAEREVALLILKGLSHKEIAALRATTEATVRQQAQSIYRKAGLPGKTAFCAYFLEDLLASDGAPDASEPPVLPKLAEPATAAKRPSPQAERAAAVSTKRFN